jgi:uncharacterized protein
MRLGACLSNARLLRPPPSGIFRRSFPLHRSPLCAGNDRRNLLAGGRPRYGDHYSGRLLWLVLLLLVGQPWALAQSFDFKPPATVSDANTPAVMRDLAERILPVYQEENPERYLANLSALQLVAGNYTAAYASRQSLRDRRRNADAGRVGRNLIVDMYTHARAIEATNRTTFAQAFTTAYKDVIPKLGDLDAYTVTGWLATPLASFRDPVQRLFDQRRSKGNIELPEALQLVQDYGLYEAYRSFGPIVGALDNEDEQRRYEDQDDILIKTRDGISISARLVRPKTTGKPLPALLEYTTYLTPGYISEVAAHGYVGVLAYARGTGKSTGAAVPFQREGEDLRAVINWIAMQPWSDGRVGMYGSTYSGYTPWAAAKRLPPALKAIAVTSPTAPGIDMPDDGAVFRNFAYRWSLYVMNAIDDKAYDDEAAWRALDQKWYASGKAYREFAGFYGKPDFVFLRWLNHPSYDRFWQTMIPYGREFAKINIPVLTITGYYAAGEAGALYYFDEHHRNNPHADHTLLIGPYDDGATVGSVQSALRGYQVDAAAQVDLRELRYEWFDHVLKGAPAPVLLQGRVNYEVMGGNEWRHAQSIDAMGNGTLKFYLDATTAVGGSHRLAQHITPVKAKTASAKGAEAKSSDSKSKSKGKVPPAFVSQEVSLADRSDATSWAPQVEIASHNVEVRNATAYVSDPLPKPLELQGQWSGRFDLTINKVDVDLRVAAYELLPNGDYIQLFEPYTLRASYAKDRIHRRLLKAGERQVLAFKIERLTSRKLQAGSRIVLILGINKRPDEEINYGTGGDVSNESLESAGKVPVRIRWYNDSYIDMPVQR